MGQLYPALVPSAPSSEAMRIPNPHSVAASAATVAHGGQAVSSAMVPVSVAAAGVEAVRAARERRAEVGSSGEVVDELLSENERLRLIIQEMSEEVGEGRWVCLGTDWVLVGIAIGFWRLDLSFSFNSPPSTLGYVGCKLN